jgi:hypothetical protein
MRRKQGVVVVLVVIVCCDDWRGVPKARRNLQGACQHWSTYQKQLEWC